MQNSTNDRHGHAEFDIRAGAPEDVEALFDVHKRSVFEQCRHHYDATQLQAIMENRGPDMYLPAISKNQLWLAYDQQGILGFVEAKTGEILKLFIDPTMAGRGVGSALMNLGMALAAAGNGNNPIRVEATFNAFAFYERFGFKKIATGYWSHGNDRIPPIEVVILESSYA
jgi:ribosomal protein S18 acetylase RimI-like enzyme